MCEVLISKYLVYALALVVFVVCTIVFPRFGRFCKHYWLPLATSAVVLFSLGLTHLLSTSQKDALKVTQDVAVIGTILLAGLEYTRRQSEGKRIKAESFIERFNAPEFVAIKTNAAVAYNERVMKWEDEKQKPRSSDEIDAFLKLKVSKPEDLKPAAEGLFSIFTVLNFFEELGHAWVGDSLDRRRIHNYFFEIVPEIYDNYKDFIQIMDANVRENYYVNLNEMVSDFRGMARVGNQRTRKDEPADK